NGIITLNGIGIIRPADFLDPSDAVVARIDRPITLRAGANEIDVLLRGRPGTSLSVEIVMSASDTTPPTITAAVTPATWVAPSVESVSTQEGNANNFVQANFPSNQSFAAGFMASGRAPGNPADTTISGVVLDNSNAPIPSVTVRAVLTNVLHSNVGAANAAPAAQTDAQGQFTIAQAPVGF